MGHSQNVADQILRDLERTLVSLETLTDGLAGRDFLDQIRKHWPPPTRSQLLTMRRVFARLHALSVPYHLIQEAWCNGVRESERPSIEAIEAKIETRARELVAELPPLASSKRAIMKFTGDPRGPTMRVTIPDCPHDGNTWGLGGEYGLGVGS
jgi:hypothetical protein